MSAPILKHALRYGLLAGVMIALLRFIEYRWLVVDRSVEIYGALIAAAFAALGIWLGRRLTATVSRTPAPDARADTTGPFVPDAQALANSGLTPRELEILAEMANGLSNREIAEAVGVSENTVKTHASRVFTKLGARRRTQAVQLGKGLRLIP